MSSSGCGTELESRRRRRAETTGEGQRDEAVQAMLRGRTRPGRSGKSVGSAEMQREDSAGESGRQKATNVNDVTSEV